MRPYNHSGSGGWTLFLAGCLLVPQFALFAGGCWALQAANTQAVESAAATRKILDRETENTRRLEETLKKVEKYLDGLNGKPIAKR